MFKLKSSENVRLTPKLAADLLLKNVLPGQRPLSDAVVRAYAAKMASGEFVKASIAVGENEAGQTMLGNGQHQCHAVIKSGVTVAATIDYYTIETEHDWYHWYGTFDSNRIRSNGQVMRAAREHFDDAVLREIPLRILNVAATALVALGDGRCPSFGQSTLGVGKAVRADIVQKYRDDVLNVAMVIGMMNVLEPSNATVGVATTIVATFRANQEKAAEFWQRSIEGVGLEKGEPCWHLHRIFSAGIGHEIPKSEGQGRQANEYTLIACWWNSYVNRDGRQLVKLSVYKEPPECLSGNEPNTARRKKPTP